MRRHLRTSAVAGLVVSALVLIPACGDSGGKKGGATETKSLAPKDALTTGVNGVGDGEKQRIKISLDAKAEDLVELSKNGDGQPLTEDQAEAIVDSFISIETKTTNGKKLSEVTDANSVATEFAINIDNDKVLEFRSVGGLLYIRADVDKLADKAGKKADLDNLKAQSGNLPPQFGFAKNALAGDWLSVDTKALAGLASQFGGRTTGGASAPPKDVKKIADQFKSLLLGDVTVTRAGTDDKGDHLVVTAKLKKLAADFAQIVQQYGGAAASQRLDLSEVPDQDATVDVHVKDGALRELAIDFTQFAQGEAKAKLGDKKIGLKIEFDEDVDDIDKPDNATAVDLTQVFGAFLQGGFGTSSGSVGASASAQATLPQ